MTNRKKTKFWTERDLCQIYIDKDGFLVLRSHYGYILVHPDTLKTAIKMYQEDQCQ